MKLSDSQNIMMKARMRTAQRLERVSNEKERKRLKRRLEEVTSWSNYFAKHREKEFLGFQGWGRRNDGVEYHVDIESNISEFDTLYYRDHKDIIHHVRLASSISNKNVNAKPLDVAASPLGMCEKGQLDQWDGPLSPPIKETFFKHLKDMSRLYQRDDLKKQFFYRGLSLIVDKKKQFFRLRGLPPSSGKKILIYLKALAVERPEIECQIKLGRKSEVQLNASSLMALTHYIHGNSKISSELVEMLKILTTRMGAVKDIANLERKILSYHPETKPLMEMCQWIRLDASSKDFSYKNSDRRGRYWIDEKNFGDLINDPIAHMPLIKGKPGLGKMLTWKWGLGIPQLLSRKLEFGHELKYHGRSEKKDGFFIDGADDTDMFLALNKESVGLIDGIQTFMIMPMAIDILNQGLEGQAQSIEGARQRKETMLILSQFVSNSADLDRRKIENIVNLLGNTDLIAEFYQQDRTTAQQWTQFFSRVAECAQQEAQSLSKDIKEKQWMYAAIWCMATGLKIHFATAAPGAILHFLGYSDKSWGSDALSSLGDMIANPIAFVGQTIASAIAFRAAWSDAKNIANNQKFTERIKKNLAERDVEEVSRQLYSMISYLKRENWGLRSQEMLHLSLAIGQALMAIGTSLSTILTFGASSPLAIASALSLCATLNSGVGLGGTLIGVGGAGVIDSLFSSSFSSTLNKKDLSGIYKIYSYLLSEKIGEGMIPSQEERLALLIKARDQYCEKHPDIFAEYLNWQKAEIELKRGSAWTGSTINSLNNQYRHKDIVQKKLAAYKYQNTDKYYNLNRYLKGHGKEFSSLENPEDVGSASFYSQYFFHKKYNDLKTFVHRVFTDRNVRDEFVLKLAQKVEYSRFKEKKKFFRNFTLHKNRRGFFRILNVVIKKKKHLKIIDREKIEEMLSRNDPQLSGLIASATEELITEKKQRAKARIRGIEFDLLKRYQHLEGIKV